MTTIIALASRHAVVMGADSLATENRDMVEPWRLLKYFEKENGWKLKRDATGEPILKSFYEIVEQEQSLPVNQSLHVNKLFQLGDFPIGVAFTGVTMLGDVSIGRILSEYSDGLRRELGELPGSVIEMEGLASALMNHIGDHYDRVFPPGGIGGRPALELLVAGYSQKGQLPTVMRLNVERRESRSAPSPGVAFGGQMDWIQRIVLGTDNANRARLAQRTRELLFQYRQSMLRHVRPHGVTDLPEPGPELELFNNWSLNGLQADWGNFSEQNAINCVDFFLRIMIEAQDVSSGLPTVGGDIHIAVIRKDGYHLVSKEVWRHGGHEVPIPEVRR